MKEQKSEEERKPYEITGFILSIVGIVLFFMPYFGIFFSISSIVLCRHKKTSLGVAGHILGIIGTVLNAVLLLLIIFAVLIVASFN